MTTPVAQSKGILSFGPFRLVASERLLAKDGVLVPLVLDSAVNL
jgi:hypothetical protein